MPDRAGWISIHPALYGTHMRIVALALVAVFAAPQRGAAALRAQIVTLTPAVDATAIVGRAVCGESTWLLTRSADLIRIGHADHRPVTRAVRDLRPGDPFRGLACVDDGSLWTLATGHQLARITSEGAIAERHTFLFPQLMLFGIGNRLVLLGLPVVPQRPLLASSLRVDPEHVQPWVGLLGRAAVGTRDTLMSNLVGCGIGSGSAIPCWFADQGQLSISDGRVSRSVSLPWLVRKGIDRSAPLRDVALLPDHSMWVLAASTESPQGRRVGGRLSRANAAGSEWQSLELTPPARLIVSADASTCVLLTTTGMLMKISDTAGSR